MKRCFSCILALFLLLLPVVSLGQMATAQANQKVFRKVTPEDNARARSLLEEADRLRGAGDYAGAAECYTRAIRLNERLGGYAGRAMCYFQLGNYELAERDANTSIHHRSANDLLLPGMMGMAEYVRGVCRYRRGDYAGAEADLKTAATSRYGSDEIRRMYQDCIDKAAAAREQAAMDKMRSAYRNVESVITQALQEGKLKAYDVAGSNGFEWRSEEDRADFEKTMFGGSRADGQEALQSITAYLWQWHIEGADNDNVVIFVPRHTIIAGTNYRDKVILARLSSVPLTISKVADLPAATRLYETHMVEGGGLAEIRHPMRLDGEEDDGYTWESIGKEIERQNKEAEYGVSVVPGLPNDYNIIPTSDPRIYRLKYRYGEEGGFNSEGWLRRIEYRLPLLP